jgi:branched-chain amino acid aminotransferase
MTSDNWSKSWTFFNNDWHEGNVPIIGVRSHAGWMCSMVFDGARAFEGVTPDLDLHCARVNDSASKMLLKPVVSVETWVGLAREAVSRFDGSEALYIRPMYWAEREGARVIAPDPESTKWAMVVYEAPLRRPDGIAITMSPFRRPTADSMPVEAKAGCLYPNNARALHEARARGFDDALMCDALGNIAELVSSNIFLVKDGTVLTPTANGTFLAGITRCRTMGLLQDAGTPVIERTLKYADFEAADEIFSTGNYSKIVPVTRVGERSLQPGPIYRKARELYWAFAHAA